MNKNYETDVAFDSRNYWKEYFEKVANQPEFHSLAATIFVQTVVSLETESPYLLIANFVQLCYPKSKQTVSKVLCGTCHIQKFS